MDNVLVPLKEFLKPFMMKKSLLTTKLCFADGDFIKLPLDMIDELCEWILEKRSS